MDNIILENINPIEHLVTPLSSYFICNHFISTEIHNDSGIKYIGINLELKANDLIKNKNYNDIKNFEIIQIQVDLFDFFYDEILPIHTVIFRAFIPNTKDKWKIKWNKWSLTEQKILEKHNSSDNLEYIIMPNAEHFIWYNQKYSDDIINKIKQLIKLFC
jgi:hypothetical protein